MVSAMVVAALLPAPAAQARRSYCSPTGDYCTGVLERGTSVRLRIASFKSLSFFRR